MPINYKNRTSKIYFSVVVCIQIILAGLRRKHGNEKDEASRSVIAYYYCIRSEPHIVGK
jgi:hypothetical protein